MSAATKDDEFSKRAGLHLLWLTDLHLDSVGTNDRRGFLETLNGTAFDAAVVTGDISYALRLPQHLLELGRACAPRQIYFVLGNHDFFASSFAAVDKSVAEVCLRQNNLNHLGSGEVIELSKGVALIGHRGWADCRAGWGKCSNIKIKDSLFIEDLSGQTDMQLFSKVEELGRASGKYFLNFLFRALTRYDHVVIATHFPPFPEAATYNGKQCGSHYLPHFVNLSGGRAIQKVARKFPCKSVTVLCGHTHDRVEVCLRPHIRVISGSAKRGQPEVQRIFNVGTSA